MALYKERSAMEIVVLRQLEEIGWINAPANDLITITPEGLEALVKQMGEKAKKAARQLVSVTYTRW